MNKKLNFNSKHDTENIFSKKCVMLLVQKLQQESYDPILLYKLQRGAVVVGSSDINLIPNSDELFMLGIQSREQRECLEKYNQNSLC